MRLSIVSEGSRRGTSFYKIVPADRVPGTVQPEVAERLRNLMPRIERMSRQQLDDDFESLEFVNGDEWLLLSVAKGTSKNKRFRFRDLCGWINLFDTE